MRRFPPVSRWTGPVRLGRLARAGDPATREPPPVSLWTLCGFALVMGVVTGLRRRGVPRPDRARPQPAVPRQVLVRLRRQPVHPAAPWGVAGDPGAGGRRARRDLPRHQLRARGEGPRRARGDGRDLLQARRDPPDRRGRRSRWPRRWRSAAARRSAAKGRSSRSARRSARRSGRSIRMPTGAAHHPGRGGRRRRHRRHLQHADRRRDVRHRTDDAGNQRHHLPAGGTRDRQRDLHRPAVLRRRSRPSPCRRPRRIARRSRQRAHAGALCGARRVDRRRGGRCSSAACTCSRISSTGSQAATCATSSACCWSAC